jgi:group I intron endonuclease
MELGIIYILEDPTNDLIKYIGQTTVLKNRYKNHCSASPKYDKNGNYKPNKCISWCKSLKNIGIKPILNILDQVPINELDFWEIYYISLYKSWGFELKNDHIGGTGGRLNKIPWNKGKKCETTERMKKSYKIRHEKFLRGEWVGPNKGKKSSKETKKKLRVSHLGNKHSGETIKKQRLNSGKSKRIIQLNANGGFIQEFNSAAEASRILNICHNSISKLLNGTGRSKTAGGYKWKFKN